MNMETNVKIVIAVNAETGVPYQDTLYSLRKARSLDDVEAVIITEKKCYVPPFVNGVLCEFVKNTNELFDKKNADGNVIFMVNSGDTFGVDAVERIKEFYGSRAISEPVPNSIRSSFITECAVSAADLYKGHKYLVSCVIAFHNANDYLFDAIDSVTGQDMFTDGDVQLILVDDGSTDGSAGVIKEYLEEYPHYDFVCVTQEHKGISAAKNAGLELADGVLVTFLDADCRMSDGYLREALSRLNARKDVDLVAFPVEILRDASASLERASDWRFGCNTVIDVSEDVRCAKLFGTGTVIRTDAIKSVKLRFDEEKGVDGDIDFLHRLLEYNPKFGASASACLDRQSKTSAA